MDPELLAALFQSAPQFLQRLQDGQPSGSTLLPSLDGPPSLGPGLVQGAPSTVVPGSTASQPDTSQGGMNFQAMLKKLLPQLMQLAQPRAGGASAPASMLPPLQRSPIGRQLLAQSTGA